MATERACVIMLLKNVKRIVILICFCMPIPGNATGMDWSAIDLKACKNWIISDHYPEHAGEAKPDGAVHGGYWGWLSAYADGSNPMDERTAKYFSSDDGTITLYGDKDFPLGRATFRRMPDSSGLMTTYRCISRCETAQVKTIYSHGWESDVENADYLHDRKEAVRRCGNKAKSW